MNKVLFFKEAIHIFVRNEGRAVACWDGISEVGECLQLPLNPGVNCTKIERSHIVWSFIDVQNRELRLTGMGDLLNDAVAYALTNIPLSAQQLSGSSR